MRKPRLSRRSQSRKRRLRLQRKLPLARIRDRTCWSSASCATAQAPWVLGSREPKPHLKKSSKMLLRAATVLKLECASLGTVTTETSRDSPSRTSLMTSRVSKPLSERSRQSVAQTSLKMCLADSGDAYQKWTPGSSK